MLQNASMKSSPLSNQACYFNVVLCTRGATCHTEKLLFANAQSHLLLPLSRHGPFVAFYFYCKTCNTVFIIPIIAYRPSKDVFMYHLEVENSKGASL